MLDLILMICFFCLKHFRILKKCPLKSHKCSRIRKKETGAAVRLFVPLIIFRSELVHFVCCSDLFLLNVTSAADLGPKQNLVVILDQLPPQPRNLRKESLVASSRLFVNCFSPNSFHSQRCLKKKNVLSSAQLFSRSS